MSGNMIFAAYIRRITYAQSSRYVMTHSDCFFIIRRCSVLTFYHGPMCEIYVNYLFNVENCITVLKKIIKIRKCIDNAKFV